MTPSSSRRSFWCLWSSVAAWASSLGSTRPLPSLSKGASSSQAWPPGRVSLQVLSGGEVTRAARPGGGREAGYPTSSTSSEWMGMWPRLVTVGLCVRERVSFLEAAADSGPASASSLPRAGSAGATAAAIFGGKNG